MTTSRLDAQRAPRGATRREFVGAAACMGAAAAFGTATRALADAVGAQGGAADEDQIASPGGAQGGDAGSGPLISQAISSGDASPLVSAMTRRQKICQTLMPDFRKWREEGEDEEHDLVEMNDEVAGIIDAYGFGGVILFANNVQAKRQKFALTYALQESALRNSAGTPAGGIPLLLGIDQEGGIVYRLGSGCAMPGNMAVGATRSAEVARGCGEVMGRELAALGINVDFAPVVDVNNNPNNPVIGLRSFSDRAGLVAELGCAELAGIQARGVAAAVKHFPGHGDAATDSHTGLPCIDKTREQLEALEFVPFRTAFEAGVDMVMTAHIQFPQVETESATSVDPAMGQINLPATLSHVFLTDILRDELGFTGVAVTDALNMDAIAANFAPADAVRRALLAGADIALMPVTMRCLDDVVALDALLDALEADPELTDARLDESVARILELKLRRGILGLAVQQENADAGERAVEQPAGGDALPDAALAAAPSYDERLAAALAEVGCEENRAFEREAAALAVTALHASGVLPFCPVEGQRVLLVAAYENECPGMELAMRRLVAEGHVPEGVAYKAVCYAGDDTGEEAVEAAAQRLETLVSQYDFAVVISEVNSTARLSASVPSFGSAYVPMRVVAAAQAAGVPAAVMSIAKPYDVALYPQDCPVVTVYGNKGMDPTEAFAPSNAFGPNIPAGVEAIFGGHAITGKLPVDVFAPATSSDGTPYVDTGQVVYPFGAGEECA